VAPHLACVTLYEEGISMRVCPQNYIDQTHTLFQLSTSRQDNREFTKYSAAPKQSHTTHIHDSNHLPTSQQSSHISTLHPIFYTHPPYHNTISKMPPCNQFPPARVFLKQLPLSTTSSAARASTLTSPLSPRTTSSPSNSSPSQMLASTQRSSTSAQAAESRRREATA
jgi:uncharacterized Zn-finger protein